MNIDDHGGQCCGIRHIYAMDHSSVDELDRYISNLDRANNVGGPDSGRLIEIVLSERQVTGEGNGGWHHSVRDAGGWPAVLAARGFRLVSRFNNANSGRNCYIFHRVPHFMSIRNQDLPFDWHHNRGAVNLGVGGPGRAAPAPAPAPDHNRVIASVVTFHNVLQAGRSDAGYSTRDAARAKAPRARRIDRKTIQVHANGATNVVWTEGV
jgi:hypothetical protein